MSAVARGMVAFALAFLAALPAGQQQGLDADLSPAERGRVEAAILDAFPAASGWRLSEGYIGFFRRGRDRRLHVDLPSEQAEGRISRHPRFDCVRQQASGSWSCGERWQMLWQVERVGADAGRCPGPVIGLDASRAPSDAAILDVVDLFSYPATAAASLTRSDMCSAIPAETLCRLALIGDGRGPRSDSEPADLAAHFRSGLSSSWVVRMNRHCDGAGPCLLEVVGCSILVVD